jgi:hypothetical protein
MTDFEHVAVAIDRPVSEVYAFASKPANLARWAGGLTTSLHEIDGEWVADSPIGRIAIRFAEPNVLGVLDHWVTLPSGSTEYNPMRAFADGEGTQVVFSVHRSPGFTDAQFSDDVATVRGDLQTLKAVLET